MVALPKGPRSPFRSIPGTHFARLTLLDRRTATFHPRHHVPLRNSWLLFAADFDGEFDDGEVRARRIPEGEFVRYLSLVDEHPALRDIWQDCVGFMPRRELADLLLPTVLDRFILFRDHGDLTLRDIHIGLLVRRQYQQRIVDNTLADANGVRSLLHCVDHIVRTTA